MSGENPILLLKSAITRSIAPRHAQTLTGRGGRKKKTPPTLTFNSLLGKRSGCCQALPTLPSHPSPRRGGTADAGPAPRDAPGSPHHGSEEEEEEEEGFTATRARTEPWDSPGTGCNKPKPSKIVVVAAFLGACVFYKHLLQIKFIFGTQCR